MRFAKYSPELTKAARFKDKRSKIGLRPDGSQLVRLAGKDMESLRNRVFRYHNFECWDRVEQSMLLDKSQLCEGPLELSHQESRGKGGDDTSQNCVPRCRKHHRIYDNREVQLRSVGRG